MSGEAGAAVKAIIPHRSSGRAWDRLSAPAIGTDVEGLSLRILSTSALISSIGRIEKPLSFFASSRSLHRGLTATPRCVATVSISSPEAVIVSHLIPDYRSAIAKRRYRENGAAQPILPATNTYSSCPSERRNNIGIGIRVDPGCAQGAGIENRLKIASP